MGKYLEQNLGGDEHIIESAEIHGLIIKLLIALGIFGIITIFLPFIVIGVILRIRSMELGFTNKKVIGKYGVISTKRLDTPLNKVDNVSVEQGLGGKIFGYGTVVVSSASNKFGFEYVKNPEIFRNKLMEQIEKFDEERIKKQAMEMAQSMKN